MTHLNRDSSWERSDLENEEKIKNKINNCLQPSSTLRACHARLGSAVSLGRGAVSRLSAFAVVMRRCAGSADDFPAFANG